MGRVPADLGFASPITGVVLAPILSPVHVSLARDRLLLFSVQPTALGFSPAGFRARGSRTESVPPADAGVDAEAPTAMGTFAMIALFWVHRRNAGNQIAWADKTGLFSERIIRRPRFRRRRCQKFTFICGQVQTFEEEYCERPCLEVISSAALAGLASPMRETQLTQRGRFTALLVEFALLCAASRFALGSWFPSSGGSGFWFYTALLGLILGSRLDTPHFVAPADVVLYAAPAATALVFEATGKSWGQAETITYRFALSYCIVIGAIGVVAILTQTRKLGGWHRVSDTARVIAEMFGTPRIIYSFVVGFAVFVYHRHSAREAITIVLAWAVVAWLTPIDFVVHFHRRIRKVWNHDLFVNADGEIVAYQSPGLALLRPRVPTRIEPREIVALRDSAGDTRLAIALNELADTEGVSVQAIEVPATAEIKALGERTSLLPANSFVRVGKVAESLMGNPLVAAGSRLAGLVAEDTSVQRLYFEVVLSSDLEEGRLVTVPIGDKTVIFQVTNGLTREEIVSQKSRYGFVRAQARKIGYWEPATQRFLHAKWVPRMNAPVLLEERRQFAINAEAVGHFPDSDFGVKLKMKGPEQIGLHAMVTHNTAIIGILGVGKSSLAMELLERMMAAGIKVVCVDLTAQYPKALTPYYDAAKHKELSEFLRAVAAKGKTNYAKNQDEGGSVRKFADKLTELMRKFLSAENPRRFLVFNPAEFEVWKQDGRIFKEGETPPMAMLTPAQLTQLVSESVLDAVAELGMIDHARVCVVYEEAHSLVPEWNSAVNPGDQSAANGTARAILQGRKYGMGCLLISQRTANVTKTILNQCNTVFAMRTFDDTGKEFLANYFGREYAEILPTLEERHAIFFGRGSGCENPVLIRLNDRDAWVEAFRSVHPPPSLDEKPAAPVGEAGIPEVHAPTTNQDATMAPPSETAS